jgi:hypothetical protein
VVASLLVSVLLLGYKLSALKRLLQVTQRKTELKAALELLQPKLEEEGLSVWLGDFDHDKEQRQSRIGEMALPSEFGYSTMESESIAECSAVFDDSPCRMTRQHNLHASMKRLVSKLAIVKYDGRDEPVVIRAAPQQVVAYILNYGGRYLQSLHADADAQPLNTVDARIVRSEVVERHNAHHTIVFSR